MTSHVEPKDVVGAGGGGGKGKGGSGAGQESSNTLRSRARARMVELISEGRIKGLVNGAQSIFFDKTALQNADGSYNFEGVVWDIRYGLPDQPHYTGIAYTETPTQVGVEVKQKEAPPVRTIDTLDADAVKVIVQLPALARQTDDGKLVGASVQYAIDIRPFGGAWTQQWLQTFTNQKTTSAYEHMTRLPLTGTGPWDVRVRRITPDSDQVKLQNQTTWESVSALVEGKFTYPNSASIYLECDAEKFGSNLPSRYFMIDGLICQVPTNYDPVARTYTGVWDGTFKMAWHNNPVWVLYDLLTHDRYGLGEFIDANKIDKWGLYQIARYCDELVPSGYKNQSGVDIMEPRYTFNGVINSREEAYRVLQNITTTFRGMAYWSLGQVFAVSDQDADPVKLVSPANVIDGHFSYQGTAMKARHSVAIVTWNDPDDFYQPAKEVVIDNDQIARFGWRETEVTLVGATSRGLAHRYGKWLLDTEKNATETISYEASWDHAQLKPGQIIAVADPAKAQVRNGGRLQGAGGTSSFVNGEAIINGDFSQAITAGWQVSSSPAATGTLAAIVSGQLQLNGNGTNSIIVDQSFTTIPGQTYTFSVLLGNTSSGTIAIGSAQATGDLVAQYTPVGSGAPRTETRTFVATSNTTWVRFLKTGTAVWIIDNVSVQGPQLNAVTGELITNGDFSSPLTTGWLTSGNVTIGSGAVTLSGVSTLDQGVTTIPGQTYTLSIGSISGAVGVSVGTTQGATDLKARTAPATAYSTTFVASSTTAWVRFDKSSGASTLDNVSIQGPKQAPPSSTSFTLDRPFPPVLGQSYSLMLAMPDGTVQSRPISAFSTDNQTVTVNPGFTDTPQPDAMWVITGTDVAPRKYRVISVEENEQHIFKVTALFHDPTKYARVERDINLQPIRYTRPRNTIQPPSNLTVRESLYTLMGTARSRLTLGWTPGTDFMTSSFEIYCDTPDLGRLLVGTTTNLTIDLDNTVQGTYTFIVTAISKSGLRSQAVTYEYDATGWDGQDKPFVSHQQIFGQGTSREFGGRDCRIIWRNNFPGSTYEYGAEPGGSGVSEQNPYYRDNVVRVYDDSSNALLREEVVDLETYTYTYEHNVEDNGGTPTRDLRFQIQVRDRRGNISDPVILQATNSVPGLLLPTVVPGDSQFYVQIPGSSDVDFKGVRVWISTTATFDPRTTTPTYDGTQTVIPVPATNDTQYWVRVAGYDAFGTDGLNISPPVAVTPTSNLNVGSAPATPTGLLLNGTIETSPNGGPDLRVRLTADWDPTPNAVFYEVDLKRQGGNFVTQIAGFNHMEWPDLDVGTAYVVRIRAVGAFGGKSAYTAETTISAIVKNTGPGAPTGVAVAAGLKNAVLSWTNPTDADLQVIEIWRHTADVRASATKVGEIRGTVYNDGNLTTGTNYYYWIRGRNSSGVAGTFNATAGIKITPGQVAPGDIAANAITADKIAAGAVTADKIQANSITATQLAIGFGSNNLLPNPDFSTHISSPVSWTIDAIAGCSAGMTQTDYPAWVPRTGAGAYIFANATIPIGSGACNFYPRFRSTNTFRLPYEAGQGIEVSAYMGNHRNVGMVLLGFYDNTDALLGYATCNGTVSSPAPANAITISGFTGSNDGTDAVNGKLGGDSIMAFKRVGLIAKCDNPNVRTVIPIFQKGPTLQNDGAGTPSSYLFMYRPYMGFCPAGQVALSDWGDGGVLIKDGEITAAKITVGTITADRLTLGGITTDRIQDGAITAIASNGANAASVSAAINRTIGTKIQIQVVFTGMGGSVSRTVAGPNSVIPPGNATLSLTRDGTNIGSWGFEGAAQSQFVGSNNNPSNMIYTGSTTWTANGTIMQFDGSLATGVHTYTATVTTANNGGGGSARVGACYIYLMECKK